jgi:hypothetical protein
MPRRAALLVSPRAFHAGPCGADPKEAFVSVFLIRAAVGTAAAYAAMRIFHPEAHAGYSLVLAGVLVGVAYIVEKLRKDREG